MTDKFLTPEQVTPDVWYEWYLSLPDTTRALVRDSVDELVLAGFDERVAMLIPYGIVHGYLQPQEVFAAISAKRASLVPVGPIQ